MTRFQKVLVSGVAIGGLAIACVLAMRTPKTPRAPVILDNKQQADNLYASQPKEAASLYEKFISENRSSEDKKMQDQVGRARLKLGYIHAKAGDYPEARTVLTTAAKEYRGTGAMGEDFGGIADQSAYQAAVCLSAEGKTAEAVKAFKSFMKEYKLSPLVHGTFRRLEKLDPKHLTDHEKLLQDAVTAQEKYIAYETSVCGPRALEYMLVNYAGVKKDYKELAKLCGTSDAGTTFEGMKKGLKKVGKPSYAYMLNRADFAAVPLPAVWLMEDHYVVVLNLTGDRATVYDPMRKSTRSIGLPALDSHEFTAPVLTLQPLELKENS